MRWALLPEQVAGAVIMPAIGGATAYYAVLQSRELVGYKNTGDARSYQYSPWKDMPVATA